MKAYASLFYAQVDVFVGRGLDGKELFVCSSVSAGDVIIEYRGTIVSNLEADKREAAYRARGWKQEYMLVTHVIEEVLDATVQRNCERLANHQCNPT